MWEYINKIEQGIEFIRKGGTQIRFLGNTFEYFLCVFKCRSASDHVHVYLIVLYLCGGASHCAEIYPGINYPRFLFFSQYIGMKIISN